ncbi:MAG: hypothetical protein ACI92O_000463 [Colwellia sp.]|jgi:hypothetical protein
MKLKVIMNTRNKSEEVFIDGINVGIFERLNLDSKAYSFMSNCSLEKLTGDHYILIGRHLNLHNASNQK